MAFTLLLHTNFLQIIPIIWYGVPAINQEIGAGLHPTSTDVDVPNRNRGDIMEHPMIEWKILSL